MNPLKPVSKQYNQDTNWAFLHYAELSKKYPNMWVACAQKRIVAVGKSITNVLELARQKVKSKQIPVIFIEKGIHIYAN